MKSMLIHSLNVHVRKDQFMSVAEDDVLNYILGLFCKFLTDDLVDLGSWTFKCNKKYNEFILLPCRVKRPT